MTDQNDKRNAAIKRLKAKRAFAMVAVMYLIVNAFLVAIWALTGAGYFWPGWVMLGWGIGLAFQGWSAYLRKPISEDDIRREMEKAP